MRNGNCCPGQQETGALMHPVRVTAQVPAQRRPLPMQLCGHDARLVDARPGWLGEIKLDGWRAQLHTGGAGRLWSRHGKDLTGAFPEVIDAARGYADRDLVLDGELVALVGGRPDWHRLSARGICGPAAALRRAARTPVTFVVWDVLLDDEDLRRLPWTQRRAALDGLGLDHALDGRPLATTEVFTDVPALLRATNELRLEGVVVKRPEAAYIGGRSHTWIKLKHAHARDLQDPPRS